MTSKTPLLGAEAPGPMHMQEDCADPRLHRLVEEKAIKLRQKPRGWCCELFCCGPCCCCCDNWENVYHVVTDNKKHTLFKMREHTSCFCLQCCGVRRSFDMTVDSAEKGADKHDHVLEFERPFHCRWFCCPCDICHQQLYVYSHKKPLGKVTEMCYICVPTINVENERGELRYQLKGENMCCRCHNCCLWLCKCCPEYTFSVNNGRTHHTEGKVKKTFAGVGKELMTNADNFKLKFPQHATANDRALLLGSVVLADYLYFERPPPAEKAEENHKNKKKGKK